MLEAEKTKESREIPNMCVRFQNTLSLFGVLDLKLHTSSYFDHYYPALRQGDLSVLFTVKTQQFTCKG